MRRGFSFLLAALMCLGLVWAAADDIRADESPVKKNGQAVSSADELRVYDVVTFGSYPMRSYSDYAGIEWVVLSKSENRVTLLSKYVIDSLPYHNRDQKTGWQGCDLNTWLNDTFVGAAFTTAEQNLINGSIMIPSMAEARSLPADLLMSEFTPYAISRGGDSGRNIWWLRDGNDVVQVESGESINVVGVVQQGSILSAAYKVSFSGKGVRPMLTIDFSRGADQAPQDSGLAAPTQTVAGPIMKGSRAVVTSDDVKLFDDVTFGTYPYRSYDDVQPVHWVVIKKNGSKIRLLSALALDCQKYQEPYGAVSWRFCSLNDWLNSTFRDLAFTTEEQGLLGSDITVLTELEARDLPETLRVTRSTEFAISRGADPSRCIWWLQDSGMREIMGNEGLRNLYCASAVREAGDIGILYYSVDMGHKTVRPVVEVDLSLLSY